MGMVVVIWAIQFGALIYAFITDLDGGDILRRFKTVLTARPVWALGGFCIAFLYAASRSAAENDISGVTFGTISFLLELGILIAAIRTLFRQSRFYESGMDMTFGSAEFATPEHAAQHGLIGTTGLRLGYYENPSPVGSRRDREAKILRPLHYTGPRHIITGAPTRSGKGVGVIAPNLLSYNGSTIVIDPKGENARITADRRAQFGDVHILDPWGVTGRPASCFNPLDILTPESETLVDDAALLATTIVSDESKDGTSRHFADQATDYIKIATLHIATAPEEAGNRHLGRLRDILTMSPAQFTEIAIAMARSKHPVVAAGAAQFITRSENENAGIISTAQRFTHFLDSPQIRASLMTSDFRMADLKAKTTSVFICLPVQRLTTHSTWLRLLIACGIADISRLPTVPGTPPVLFLLDEFAALGRLQIVLDAYGLMAGMGIQLFAILQDLSQLQRLYGEGWQTFIANAGVLQFFNTRDLQTAEYVSKLIGVTTCAVHSTSENWGRNSGSSSGKGGYSSNSGTSSGGGSNRAPTQRPLLFPDELMRMPREAQILLIENANPVLARKIVWYEDPAYKALGVSDRHALS